MDTQSTAYIYGQVVIKITYHPLVARSLLLGCKHKKKNTTHIKTEQLCSRSAVPTESLCKLQAVGRSRRSSLIPAARDLASGPPNAPKAPAALLAAPLSPRQTAHRSLY